MFFSYSILSKNNLAFVGFVPTALNGPFTEEVAGGPVVAPSYANLESTRSHFDPPPAASNYSFHYVDVKLGIDFNHSF